MKNEPLRRKTHALACAAVLAAMAGCAAKPAATSPTAAAVQAPAPKAEAEPTEAKDILLRMARLLARTPRFSATVGADYDVVQESGEKITFGETLKIDVKRPNQLHIEAEQSNGDTHIVLYDGKDITAFTPSQNVYAQSSKPGGIDVAVTYFLDDLHMRLPLSVLLLSRFPAEIESRTLALSYVEKTDVQGTPAHHLAGRTDAVDYQVWIAQGAQPLPLRVVLTYLDDLGQPQFRARFSEWNLAPELPDARFAFTPPEGARKIAFLAEIPQIAPQVATTPKKTGGRK